MALPNATSFSDLSNNTGVSSPQTDNSTNYNVGLLVNQNDVAEGPTIPPIQQGQFRIPRPNGFGVSSITNAKPMGALIVFTWEDIDSFGSTIGEYRILANFAYDQNANPTEVGSSQNSPCTVQVVSPSPTSAVFFLRPYLTNGQTLPLGECPSCTVALPAPVFQLAEGNDIIYIDGSRPSGGGSGPITITTFNGNSTWLVPTNVTQVTVECWGPGGKGGDGGSGSPTFIGGGGAGGGGYGTATVTGLVPGTTYNIYVPGGSSGLSSYTDIDPTIFGNGGGPGDSLGNGGSAGFGSTTSGVAGSATAIGDGGAGGAAAGGGGAGGAGGAGGVAGGAGSVGDSGVVPGGGGGGGGGGQIQTGRGGDGSAGRVKLTFSTSAGTGNQPGIGVSNSNGQLSSLTDATLLFINTSGKVVTALGNSSGSGFMEISDGTTPNTTVFLPGTAATATGGGATLPANPVKFILVNVGGTDYRIPVYAV